jgi:hypothetical protein
MISNQEGNGVPIREPSVALLTVNTADRLQFDFQGYAKAPLPSINNLLINTQQTLVQGYFTRIALTELNIPWNIPNVNTRNNTLTLSVSDGEANDAEITVTVPEGFYNGAELAQALTLGISGEIAALGGDYPAVNTIVVSYFPESCQFEIVNTDEVTGEPFLIIPKNVGQFDDLTNMMGFGAIPSTVTPKFEWFSGYASLQYTPFIDIVSQQLTKKQKVNDASTAFNTGRKLLHRLYLTPKGYTQLPVLFEDETGPISLEMPGTKPFIIHEEFTTPKQIAWDAEEFINILDLTLNDYKGNLLYEVPAVETNDYYQFGTGNTNWTLTFQVTEE